VLPSSKLPTTYTPAELAAALKCSRQSITRRCCVSGEIPATKVGDLWRIHGHAAEKLIGQRILAAAE